MSAHAEFRMPELVWGDDPRPYTLNATEGAHASGWQIQEHPRGLWWWAAWGPRGRRNGGAESEADAREKARQAEREMCRDA